MYLFLFKEKTPKCSKSIRNCKTAQIQRCVFYSEMLSGLHYTRAVTVQKKRETIRE